MNPKLAFPRPAHQGKLLQAEDGMELRDWFATFAPEPTEAYIGAQSELDRAKNPHGDTYRRQRRTREEIVADYKYTYADAMMSRREIRNER